MTQACSQDFSTIDIVFNIAGIVQKIKTEEMSYQDWKRTIDVNNNAL